MQLPKFRLVWGLMLAAFCAVCVRVPAQSSDPSLVLYYDFDQISANGMITDLSGMNNHGWQPNATNLLTSTNGVFGTPASQFTYAGFISNDFPNIYQFSQYIAVTNLAGFFYLTNGTISVWARFDTNKDFNLYLIDTGYNPTYARDKVASSNAWVLGRIGSAYLRFCTYPPYGGVRYVVNWPTDVIKPGGTTPNLGTTAFHLYTVTFNCTANRAVAYYDGAPYMTNTIDLPWLRIYGGYLGRWMCIGAMTHDGTPAWGDDKYPNAAYFVGRMDDLRIYNRELSANDVLALYQGLGTRAQVNTLALEPNGIQSVRLGWIGLSNAIYQAETRTDLTSGSWLPFAAPILSTGGTDFVTNSVSGENQKFYRVRPLP
jgi:hypothetical protein